MPATRSTWKTRTRSPDGSEQRVADALVATEEKPHTIVRLIADREKELASVEARLAAFAAAPGAVNLETRRLEKEARLRMAELHALLDRNPDEARVALEALLDGPLSFAPIETEEGKRYAITGKIAVGSLFSIESVPKGTLGMVNRSSFDGLDRIRVAIGLVA